MNFLLLKRLRVGLSIFFLIILAFAFIDFRKSFSKEDYSLAVFFQFVPSLIRNITVSGIVDFGVLLVLILTILFGRIYCSVLCPLGIFQDVVSWLSGKTSGGTKSKKKRKYKYHKAWTILRYSLLALVSCRCFLAASPWLRSSTHTASLAESPRPFLSLSSWWLTTFLQRD